MIGIRDRLGGYAEGGGSGATGATIGRVAFYSLLVNLFLVGAKLVLSAASGSLALRADAVHSSVDVFASLALILGLFISGRKSRSFPYGLYKVENLVSVFISILLFLTAYEIFRVAAAGGSPDLSGSSWILAAVAVLIPVPLLFGSYEVRVGRLANSPSLMADGRQFKADALTASLVLFALMGQRYGLPLDRAAAAVISLFIVRAGWEILVSGMRVLLDASVDSNTLGQIRTLIEEEPSVSSVREVTARNSGRYLFVEASLGLRITGLERAHQVGRCIEGKIREKVPNVDRVLIHYEPQARDHLRYAVALAGLGGEISRHFGESPYFALVDVDVKEMRVKRQEMVANPHKDEAKGRGLKVAGFLLGLKPDVVMARESLSGKGPGYAFAEAGVVALLTEATTLEDLVGQLVAGQSKIETTGEGGLEGVLSK